MSKKSKEKAKLKRRADKNKRKAAKKALYESFRDRGVNKKSKRARKNSRLVRQNLSTVSHSTGRCWNVGCIRCFGICYRPFLRRGKPFKMPHWMWLRWTQLSKEEQKKQAA